MSSDCIYHNEQVAQPVGRVSSTFVRYSLGYQIALAIKLLEKFKCDIYLFDGGKIIPHATRKSVTIDGVAINYFLDGINRKWVVSTAAQHSFNVGQYYQFATGSIPVLMPPYKLVHDPLYVYLHKD